LVRIKSYSGAKGFGYIEREGGEDLLFDVTSCERFTPRVGDEVEAVVVMGRDGRPRAHSVRLRARAIPDRATMGLKAERLQSELAAVQRLGLLPGLEWQELCEHFLRRRENLPEGLAPEDLVGLLVDRWSRGRESPRLLVHSTSFHPPKAFDELTALLEDTPVRLRLIRHDGDEILLSGPAFGDEPVVVRLGGLPDLVACFNRALAEAGWTERVVPLEHRGDEQVYVRLSLESLAELRQSGLLPVRWPELDPFL
jgi:cold shock CspA family protein